MRLKRNTEKSSDQIRGIATLVLLTGIIIAVLLVLAGIANVKGGYSSGYGYYYRRSILDMIFGSQAIVYFIISALVFFYHYVGYVILSAYATLIENSDRTDVVEALLDINETLKHNNDYYELPPNKKVINRAVDAIAKKQNQAEDVELEKIDISDIKDD